MLNNLTTRQQSIFDTIKNHLSNKGYPPSIRDIGKEVGLKSSSTVSGHLVKLRDKGLIDWEEGKPRTLHVISKEDNEVLV
ncbi:transcriptional regulator [Peribacillus loiseleuriae]|uniref:Transcriptional regulator n=1 Tax=Peribacillus loiseleuriae TaxID=1679170 RepID=A0A0K9GRM6_9BACI|nr:transcriptional regulator [Peribacillus loiseleuriae]KMY49256.1 transcriptional regulator [Peribacillus loiseleuriae]